MISEELAQVEEFIRAGGTVFAPDCISRTLGELLRVWWDLSPAPTFPRPKEREEGGRRSVLALLPAVAGTGPISDTMEGELGWALADWLVRVATPICLRLCDGESIGDAAALEKLPPFTHEHAPEFAAVCEPARYRARLFPAERYRQLVTGIVAPSDAARVTARVPGLVVQVTADVLNSVQNLNRALAGHVVRTAPSWDEAEKLLAILGDALGNSAAGEIKRLAGACRAEVARVRPG